MSYAGKSTHGRRIQHREVSSPVTRREERVPARHMDRQVVLREPRPTGTTRPAESTSGVELDWRRVTLFVAGVVTGAAAGVGAALLLAPQSGEETRRALLRRGRRFRGRTADAWDELRHELLRATRRARRRLRDGWRDRREERHDHRAALEAD